ncbi:MAG TPA: DUF5681 domain-containing protein [Rhizomicrobium sp.]|nr:DUF5681 domain-containing protein [Rhizomicrobium sp.]
MGSNPTYAVGYGKPPKHTRWQKGQSGNPKGRPKRNRDVTALVSALLEERVVVRKGKTTKKMRRIDHLLDRMIDHAVAGDPRFLRLVLDEAHKSAARAETEAPPPSIDEKDREVIDAVLQRLGVKED